MRAFLIGVVGPLVALIVIWQPAVSIPQVSPGVPPSADTVARSRTIPDDAVLVELRDFAVSYPRFQDAEPSQVLRKAEQMLAGEYRHRGIREVLPVPFEPGEYLSGSSGWHLDIASFTIPSMLGRAYEISGSAKYLEAAIQYVLDWAEYEARTLVPRGLVFNDHAISARTIVATEIWRLYRSSDSYDPDAAAELLQYMRRLSRLLLDERLFEYRSNHGIMQTLALLHLATAFPSLLDADRLLETGVDRLNAQLEYFVNAEGVVLEHSTGYHWNGINRLSAAWRYLGMNDIPVSKEMIERYERALAFGASLRRPDGTLPVIGDTEDTVKSPYRIAEFDEDRIASRPLRESRARDFVAIPLTIAAGAGYVILWNGLEHWPEAGRLDQTVIHWGNFPSGVHKHADDLGVSLWASGTQWVRGVGYWPYDEARVDAIGWRSSNGPHWLNENYAVERTSSLLAFAADDRMSYFDLLRSNADGREVRRQVFKAADGAWAVVDSFDSPQAQPGEIVWRFSPDLALEKEPDSGYIEVSAPGQAMRVLFDAPGEVRVDVDRDGAAEWNSGFPSASEAKGAPAIRMLVAGDRQVMLTVFEPEYGRSEAPPTEAALLEWNSATDWQAELSGRGENHLVIRRWPDSVGAAGAAIGSRALYLSQGTPQAAEDAADGALSAYREATARYGEPFQLMLERRQKVTAAVLVAAVLQVALFVGVSRRFRRWWPPLLIASSAGWAGLSAFLGLRFLA